MSGRRAGVVKPKDQLRSGSKSKVRHIVQHSVALPPVCCPTAANGGCPTRSFDHPLSAVTVRSPPFVF